MIRRSLILLCATVAFAAPTPTPNSPSQLIAAMHDQYAKTWYHTLTFEQQSVTHKPDGTTSAETWYEAVSLPGRLRIAFRDKTGSNGAVFAKNHQYIFKDGKLVNDKDFVHPLLVLGFDVYAQPVETTVDELKSLHIDLATMHEENWQGRPTYVVGAKQGDTHVTQFWIDKERLYFVRLLEPDEKDPKSVQDIRFDDYLQVAGGGWVAVHVAVYANDKLVFEEKYTDVQVNQALSDDLFDTAHFTR